MQPNLASGFDDSFRRHLAVEQRRAVLDTIARELTPDTTLGDIVDAAHDLGWADNFGELSLADLALALLGTPTAIAPTRSAPPPPVPHAAKIVDNHSHNHDDSDDSDDDDDDDSDLDSDDDDLEAEQEKAPPAARRGRPATREPVRKPSSLDRALDRIDKALAARGRKNRSEPRGTGKLTKSMTAAKPGKAKKLAKKAPVPLKKPPVVTAAALLDDDDNDTEAMSLDQAARLLVPLVRKLKEATMQDLEEQTHMGRRKLRFHIGQLVKHEKLRRHGMGRGTCYTVK